MTTTPNMSLVLPIDQNSNGQWDVILDTVFGLIDGHDHTTGKGVKVQSAALKINADISWSFGGVSYAITELKAIDFVAVAASTVSGLAGALFLNSADNELYYRTTSGTNVKLTAGASLNVAAFTGGIGGDYSATGALVVFDDATDSYWFQQQVGSAVRQYARMRSADVDLYEYKAQPAAGVPTNRVRLASPAALAASYALTFPGALPGSGSEVVNVTSAGQVVFGAQHGARTLLVPAAAFSITGANSFYNSSGGIIGLTGGNVGAFTAVAPILLPIGGRVLAIRLYMFDSITGPTKGQASFVSTVGTTGVSTVVASSAVSAGNATFQTLTIGSLTTTFVSATAYIIRYVTTTGTDINAVVMAEVDYDRP